MLSGLPTCRALNGFHSVRLRSHDQVLLFYSPVGHTEFLFLREAMFTRRLNAQGCEDAAINELALSGMTSVRDHLFPPQLR